MKKVYALKYFILFTILQNQSFSQANLLALKIDSIFSKHKANQAGICINIQQNDQTLYYNNFGSHNKTKAFDDFTIVDIGELKNTFISYTILYLHQQGKLSLEDNLLTFFPDIQNKHTAQKIKVWHLLSHTSGIKNNMLSKPDSIAFCKGNTTIIFNYLNELSKEPGSEFYYSSFAYQLLAAIITKVSGKNWQDYIKENIFVPTGMTFTKFSESGSVVTNVVDLKKYAYAIRYCLIYNSETIKLSKLPYTPKEANKNNLTYYLCWNFSNPVTPLSDAVIFY
ncbi:MAG: serine hydrolase, partial [Bacteroidia bacterium]|nr:serine hydrolase [Bacteroidia bacterium]